MTATERLRGLLDKRGVEWYGDIATYWGGADAVESVFADNALDVSLYAISPEQAIEATLGRGTCRNAAPAYLDFLCSECGFVHYHSDENDDGDGNDWRYCPNCGRRVVAGDA